MEKWQSPTTSGADRVIGDKLALRSTDITNNETSPKLRLHVPEYSHWHFGNKNHIPVLLKIHQGHHLMLCCSCIRAEGLQSSPVLWSCQLVSWSQTEHSCSREWRNEGSYGSPRLWMDGDLWTSLLRHTWCLSVCCGQDRESHVNRARIQVMAFFSFFFHEIGKILQNFLKVTSPESSSHIATPWLCLQICGVSSAGRTWLLITRVERASKAWGNRGDTLPGNGDARSLLEWRRTAACRGLETHSNYFQTAWASQHPRSIFHLPLVSQVIVAKEKSKPNISNLSGLTNPSAAWEDEGMVTAHRTGFAQFYETLFSFWKT